MSNHEPCLCGDTACPVCGTAQGTYRAAESMMEELQELMDAAVKQATLNMLALHKPVKWQAEAERTGDMLAAAMCSFVDRWAPD